MGERVVVVGEAVGVDETVQERRVGAADDIVVTLVLHVHHEHVIEGANLRDRRFRWDRSRGQAGSTDREGDVVGEGRVVVGVESGEDRVPRMQVHRHLCELGTGRQGSGGAAILEHGLEEALEHRDRAEGGRTQVELVGVEEVNLDRGRPRVDQPAAQLRAEVIGHAGSRRGGEGDRLGQRRCRHIAAAEELGITGPAARRWESHARWQIRRGEGQADRPHIAWGAVLDHRGGAGHGPARNTHRTVAR